MQFIFRSAETGDLAGVLRLIQDARVYLARQGVDQWQDGFPHAEVLAADVARGQSYVMQAADGRLAATAVLQLAHEPDYDLLQGGVWLQNGEYACIHRVAVAAAFRGSGIAGRLMAELEAAARRHALPALRVDTHPDNLPMQKLLQKSGFTHCGTIFLLRDGAERLAYEKLLAAPG